MRRINWPFVLRWALAAFFVFGGFGNIFASQTILADYVRWGYPHWFHYVTGLLELSVTAVLILWPRRIYGPILAAQQFGEWQPRTAQEWDVVQAYRKR